MAVTTGGVTEGMSFDMPHLKLCQITRNDARDCQNPVLDDCPLDICEMHALMTVAFMKERGGATMRRLEAVYEEPPVTRELKPRAPMHANGRTSVVYYMQFGQTVKIGFSTSLRKRVESLRPDAVVAIEPGRRGDEFGQHVRFAAKRLHGEFFQLDRELIDHINMLREMYGDPMHTFDLWSAQAAAA